MENRYDIFISYSRKDTAIADQICKALDYQGVSYFIDRQGIGGGQEFPAILADAIIGCRIMLYLASENSYSSKFTNNEINFAFNEKPKGSILPYIIDGSHLPATQRFIFASVNIRTLKDHPIDTILIQDLCQLLGRPYKAPIQAEEEVKRKEEPVRIKHRMSSLWQTLVRYKHICLACLVALVLVIVGLQYVGDDLDNIEMIIRENNMTPEQIKNKAESYYSSKNYVEAAKWYRKAAERDVARAQFNLGVLYEEGKGVKLDYVEAVKWYRKAAEQGDVRAQNNLGNMYRNGYGVKLDNDEAVKWYRKAAEKGHVSAQYNLGAMYENGEGVGQDKAEAVMWYRKAAEQGDVDAKTALTRLGYSE